MGRLRARLDRLENHAHQTMNEGEQLIALAEDLIKDLADGIKIELQINKTKIPIIIKIDPRD